MELFHISQILLTNLINDYNQVDYSLNKKTPRVETLGEQTWKPTTKCIEY